MKKESQQRTSSQYEAYTLTNDSGVSLQFFGRIFSETSYHDEESGTITRLRLFTTSEKKQVYSIITSTGREKTHRFYTITPDGDLCEMSDGTITLSVPTHMLFSSVFSLCGLEMSDGKEKSLSFEETLNAAIAG